MATRMIKGDLLRWIYERRASDWRPFNRHLLRDRVLELVAQVYSNLFHLDELTVHSDILFEEFPSAICRAMQQDACLKKMMVLIYRNASGVENSPLLIYCPYLVKITDEDHSIDTVDNQYPSSSKQKILLLHRNRANAFRGLELSYIKHIFLHSCNLRFRETIRTADNRFDLLFESKRKAAAGVRSRESGNLREIRENAAADWEKRSSLKRTLEEEQLDEDSGERASNAKSNDNSIIKYNRESRSNEDIVSSSSAKRAKVCGVETLDAVTRRESEEVARTIETEKIDSGQTITGATASGTSTNHARKSSANTTADYEKASESSRASSDRRSMKFSSRLGDASVSDIASQQVFDDTSTADSSARPSAKTVISLRNETESSGLTTVDDGNDDRSSQLSRKRRSRSVDAGEERNPANDSEPGRERKRTKLDFDDWTKQCGTTFVFGLSDGVSTTVSVALLNGDNAPLSWDCVQQPRLRRSCETEKSIFTIRPRKNSERSHA